MCSDFLSKLTELTPLLQIGRAIKFNMIFYCQRHHPLVAHFIPRNFWVAEITNGRVWQYRIMFVLRPRAPFIHAVCDALCLKIIATRAFPFRIMIGVNRYHRWRLLGAQAARVFPVNHRASAEDESQRIRIQGNGEMLPMDHVFTHSMAPMHRTPHGAIWIVLIKKMILTFIIHHTIRVVHPACCRCEMVLRTKGFVAGLIG